MLENILVRVRDDADTSAVAKSLRQQGYLVNYAAIRVRLVSVLSSRKQIPDLKQVEGVADAEPMPKSEGVPA